MSNLKERLRNEVLFGTWVRIPHPSIIEALSTCDLDFIQIDMEHGPIGTGELNQLLLAAKAVQIPAMVRAPGRDAAMIGRTLDMGASGVIVPQVNSVEEIKRVIEAARLYPLGNRGLGGACRADSYGKVSFAEFSGKANDQTVLAVQIESKLAVDHLDEILDAAKEAVDLFYIGSADLSQSLGIPGQFTHPLLQETIAKIIRKVSARGKVTGIHVGDPELAREYKKMGVHYVSSSFDIGILIAGTKQLVREFC